MNTSGEVADLMVKEGIQITESAVKLVAVGAKELTVLLLALLSDKKKLQGKTNLKNLLKSEKPLCILQIKEDDLSKFSSEAKKYGVLFSAVTDKSKENEFCDIIAKQEDVSKLNYIMEKLGYAATEQEIEPEPEREDKEKENVKNEEAKEEPSKNPLPRANENQQERESSKHGDTEKTDNTTEKKKSVKKKVEDIKKEQEKAKTKKAPEKAKNQNYPQFNKKKKKKSKSKGKSK